jgi:metal-responsive CopG/Arc/MetJ family transcriptional regulator
MGNNNRVTISLKEDLLSKIDAERDLIPRSAYIARILEKALMG